MTINWELLKCVLGYHDWSDICHDDLFERDWIRICYRCGKIKDVEPQLDPDGTVSDPHEYMMSRRQE